LGIDLLSPPKATSPSKHRAKDGLFIKISSPKQTTTLSEVLEERLKNEGNFSKKVRVHLRALMRLFLAYQINQIYGYFFCYG
jgi:hypothetical protein